MGTVAMLNPNPKVAHKDVGGTSTTIAANGVSAWLTVNTGVAANRIVSADVTTGNANVYAISTRFGAGAVSFNLVNRASASQTVTPTVRVHYLEY